MRRALILLGLLLHLGGCAAGRSAAEVAVAPDPTIYPAPAEATRYRPWAGVFDQAGLR